MKNITKTVLGTLALSAVAVTSAAPSFAQGGPPPRPGAGPDRDRGPDRGDRDRGIDAGDVIAGALIVGGIAAVASSIDNDDRRYDRRVYGPNRSREAIEHCVEATENRANRRSFGGRSDVTDIRSVTRQREGYVVRGRVAVNTLGRGWRQGDRRYGRGWGGDYRGWNENYRGWDAGNFTCRVRYGDVTSVRITGIRGLS